MDKIDMRHVSACYEAWRRKKAYESSLDGYMSRPFLSRVFSRRPRDPFRGLSLYDLSNLVSASFEGTGFAGGVGDADMRLGAYSAKAVLSVSPEGELSLTARLVDNVGNTFSEEHFEMKEGYGFIHGYQHDPDLQNDNRNRQYAYSCAIEGRYRSIGFFDVFYRKLDGFRFDPAVRRMADVRGPLSAVTGNELRSLRALVGEVGSFVARERDRNGKMSAFLDGRMREYAVQNVNGYVWNVFRQKQLLAEYRADHSRIGDMARARFEAARQCNLDSEGFFPLLVQSQPVAGRDPLDRIFMFAVEKQVFFGDDAPDSEFKRMAYLNGYRPGELREFYSESLGRDMPESFFMTDYRRLCREYEERMTRSVDAMVSIGHYDGSTVGVELPVDGYRRERGEFYSRLAEGRSRKEEPAMSSGKALAKAVREKKAESRPVRKPSGPKM